MSFHMKNTRKYPSIQHCVRLPFWWKNGLSCAYERARQDIEFAFQNGFIHILRDCGAGWRAERRWPVSPVCTDLSRSTASGTRLTYSPEWSFLEWGTKPSSSYEPFSR